MESFCCNGSCEANATHSSAPAAQFGPNWKAQFTQPDARDTKNRFEEADRFLAELELELPSLLQNMKDSDEAQEMDQDAVAEERVLTFMDWELEEGEIPRSPYQAALGPNESMHAESSAAAFGQPASQFNLFVSQPDSSLSQPTAVVPSSDPASPLRSSAPSPTPRDAPMSPSLVNNLRSFEDAISWLDRTAFPSSPPTREGPTSPSLISNLRSFEDAVSWLDRTSLPSDSISPGHRTDALPTLTIPFNTATSQDSTSSTSGASTSAASAPSPISLLSPLATTSTDSNGMAMAPQPYSPSQPVLKTPDAAAQAADEEREIRHFASLVFPGYRPRGLSSSPGPSSPTSPTRRPRRRGPRHPQPPQN